MHEQPHSIDPRVRPLEQSVERLTTEVTSLKLELATLVSALREAQSESAAARLFGSATPVKVEPLSRPSAAPAAIVILLATGLLSWQLITGPDSDRTLQPVAQAISQDLQAATVPFAEPVPVEAPAIEPPALPVAAPTVYKGTLSVKADQPGARVFVNRRDVGAAPVRVRNLKAGAHLVWIESEGYRRWTRVVTVPAEQITSVSADLEPVEPVLEP